MEKCRSVPQYGKFELETTEQEDHRKTTTHEYSSSKSYNFNGPSNYNKGSSSAGAEFSTLNDPERKRKKRVASYNMFTVEGKLKSSVKSSFKWVKNKFVVDTDVSSSYGDA